MSALSKIQSVVPTEPPARLTVFHGLMKQGNLISLENLDWRCDYAKTEESLVALI
jgi:hypothetical protein